MINTSRPVIQMDLEGNPIKEFDSITAAAKQFGGKNSDVHRIQYVVGVNYSYRIGENAPARAKGKRVATTAFGYRWKYKEN